MSLLILFSLFFMAYFEYYLLFRDNGLIFQKNRSFLSLPVLPYELKNIDIIKMSFNSLYKYSFPVSEFLTFGFSIYFSLISLYYFLFFKYSIYFYIFLISFLHFFIPYYFLYIREYKRLFLLGFNSLESWLEAKYSKIDIKSSDELIFLSKNKCVFDFDNKKIKVTDFNKYNELVIKTLKCIGIASIQSLYDVKKTEKYFIKFFLHLNKYNFFIVDSFEQIYLINIDKNKIYVKEVDLSIDRKYFSFYKENKIYNSILARSIESLILVSIVYIYFYF